ncbi:L-type lectin-domain containing receptor kinase IX.1 [Linum perenne]
MDLCWAVAEYKYGYGDGFAFFLAPFDSKLSNASIGGTLGLTGGAHGLNTINSLRSVRTIPWAADVMGGRRSEAWISYDSSTRNLSVAVSGEYLPEQVRFGFSGSTGDQVAIHRIHSWDFSSTLKAVASNRTGEGVIGNRGRKGNRVALFSGLFGGIFGALLLLICLGFVFKKRIGKNGDDGFEMDEEFEKGAGPSKFSFKELARATNNFNERDNKLGEGGFGLSVKFKTDGSLRSRVKMTDPVCSAVGA